MPRRLGQNLRVQCAYERDRRRILLQGNQSLPGQSPVADPAGQLLVRSGHSLDGIPELHGAQLVKILDLGLLPRVSALQHDDLTLTIQGIVQGSSEIVNHAMRIPFIPRGEFISGYINRLSVRCR